MNNQRRPQDNRNRRDNRNPSGPKPQFDTGLIKLDPENLPTNLFSQVAENAAKYAAEWDGNRADKNASKPTQLRKFYDEICMWNEKSQRNPEHFDKYLPFILMLKAKVAYSKGRKHVNENYVNILNHCLSEIEKDEEHGPETLHNLKLFMEAFTGFYKVYGPSN